MGSCWSKVTGVTSDQALWADIIDRKTPTADQTNQLPNLPDLTISSYGIGGIAVTPDASWPDKYELKVSAVREFYDIQQRFTVDKLNIRMLGADALNELVNMYCALPSAELKEIHFIRSDTHSLTHEALSALLKTIHTRSTMYDMTDTEGAIRVDKCRSLGADGMVHCLFFFENELIYEQSVNRFAPIDIQGTNRVVKAQHNQQRSEGPVNDPNSQTLAKQNWKSLKRGQQPPFRLFYPELSIEIKGSKAHITPDRHWGDALVMRASAAKVSNYMQYVDTDTVTVWCQKLTQQTTDTFYEIIQSLSVSRALMTAKRINFVSGDFSKVTYPLFCEFLEMRKPFLEVIGFDNGCVNLDQARAALNNVYDEDKHRPDRLNAHLANGY